MVPHQNRWGSALTDAMAAMSMTVMSAASFSDSCSGTQCLSSRPIAHAPMKAATGQGYNGSYSAGIFPASKVLQQIDAQVAQYGFSVVMGHPQDFCHYPSGEVDPAAMSHIYDLLDALRDGCYDVVFMRELMPERAAPKIAPGPIVPFNATPGTRGHCPQGRKPVVLRFDDVQDYFLSQCQLAFIDTVKQHNAKASMYAITDYFGRDAGLLSGIKAGIASGNIEIGNFGRDATTLWSDLSQSQALALLRSTEKKLFTLTGVWPTTLLPRRYAWNQALLYAMQQLEMTVMSTQASSACTGQTCLARQPALAVFGGELGSGTDGSYSAGLYTTEKVVSTADEQIKSSGYSVVVVHPQDLCKSNKGEVDTLAVARLEDLLGALNAGCYELKFMRELGPNGSQPKTSEPSTADPTPTASPKPSPTTTAQQSGNDAASTAALSPGLYAAGLAAAAILAMRN